jgi:hypothetical protein
MDHTRPRATKKTARLTNTTQKGIATKFEIDTSKIALIVFGNER